MNIKVYYFFTMLSIVRSDNLFLQTVNNEFNMFVEDLIITNFNTCTNIGIFHDFKGIFSVNLPQFLEKLHASVMIHDLINPVVSLDSLKLRIPKQIDTPTNNNIIIIEDSKDLESMLEMAKSIPFFSARTNVLVIITKIVTGTELWIREIFSQLWKIYIINVGLVFYNDRINLLTYNPWTSPHEIKNLTDQGISSNIFYDKVKNLNGYPIKILLNLNDVTLIAANKGNSTSYLGIDGMTMSTILQRYNATCDVIIESYESLSPCRFVHYNYTIQGLFGADARNESIQLCPFSLQLPTHLKKPSELEVISHDVDVQFDARPMRFDIDYRVDTSSTQRRDSYCILIPVKKKLPPFFNLVLPLEGYLWLAIMFNFVLHSAIYFGIHSTNNAKKKGFFYTCLMLYRIQINSAAPNDQKIKNSEKTYLFCWVLYSFLISASYQSVLISFITVPFYISPINRIEDLRRTDFPIFVQADILTDMPNAIDEETSRILRERIVLDMWNGERKYDVNNGYLVAQTTAQYLLERKDLMDDNGRPLFHLMDECPMPQLMSYQMPRGSPLLQIINQFTSSKDPSGLDKKWQADARLYKSSETQRPDEWREKRVVLTVAHLQGAFYILFIGEALAIIAFVLEFSCKLIRSMSRF